MIIGKIGGQSAGLNISAINRGIAHKYEAATGRKPDESRIFAIISPEGKKQSMIEQLIKQKQDLTERMNSMSATTSESGINIEDQMEGYRKQLEAIDEQILKLQSQTVEEEKDAEKTGIYEKPMTAEEAEFKKINDIMNLAFGSDHTEVISSAKNQKDGRIHILEAEIKIGYGNIESKIEEIAELESKSADLASKIWDGLSDQNDKVEDIRDESEEVEVPEDEKELISLERSNEDTGI